MHLQTGAGRMEEAEAGAVQRDPPRAVNRDQDRLERNVRMCQRGHLRTMFWILLVLAGWTACACPATAQPSLIGRSKDPIQGAMPKGRINEVRAERFMVDPPTLENLGFRWYVSGDSNRSATVAVAFREKGDSEWTEALPMLRVYHEIANQDYGPYRVGNLFAGSVL